MVGTGVRSIGRLVTSITLLRKKNKKEEKCDELPPYLLARFTTVCLLHELAQGSRVGLAGLLGPFGP